MGSGAGQFHKKARENANKCANYLLKYKDYMRYDEYLAKGFPIATGVAPMGSAG